MIENYKNLILQYKRKVARQVALDECNTMRKIKLIVLFSATMSTATIAGFNLISDSDTESPNSGFNLTTDFNTDSSASGFNVVNISVGAKNYQNTNTNTNTPLIVKINSGLSTDTVADVSLAQSIELSAEVKDIGKKVIESALTLSDVNTDDAVVVIETNLNTHTVAKTNPPALMDKGSTSNNIIVAALTTSNSAKNDTSARLKVNTVKSETTSNWNENANPFNSIFETASSSTAADYVESDEGVHPLQQHQVESYTLVALIDSKKSKIAMIRAKNGQEYFVRMNDTLGNSDGRITGFSKNAIEVTQKNEVIALTIRNKGSI
jgi:Tfp pilus assembly protein PilP